MKIVFISDFFKSDLIGGAELNDSVLIGFLQKYHEVRLVHSKNLKSEDIINNEYFIVSNFVNVPINLIKLLETKKYIIYEHDHKYVSNRNPSQFINFTIPKHLITNKRFYQNAHKVFVLSKICKKVIENNLEIDNVINIGTSLWSEKDLSFIESICNNKKVDKYCIVNSHNLIKGTREAIQYAKDNNLDYEIVGPLEYNSLLTSISKFKSFIFVPKVLETFSRITIESKMLNCRVLTNRKLIGAAYEDLYALNGVKLIQEVRDRINRALELFNVTLASMMENKKTICFIGKFDNLYDEEGKAKSLERSGFRVVRIDETNFNRFCNDTQRVFISKPDYLFYTKLRVPNPHELLNLANQNSIKTVCWIPDLYFGIDREKELLKNPIFKSDYTFTPDGGNQDRFLNLNISHHCIHQGISREYIRDFSKEHKKFDIVFIGTLQQCHQPTRGRLLNFLHENYKDRFFWFGKESDNQFRDFELSEIYRQSKIVIGDCVASDHYWSNRVYEVTGRGCCLVHPEVIGLDSEFENQKEIVFFDKNNLSDLKSKIDYLLANDAERQRIAFNGYKKTSQNYTLDNRVIEIRNVLNEQ